MAVIQLPSGVIPRMQFASGNEYVGNNTIIQNNSTGANEWAGKIENASNVTVRNVTFAGNGIHVFNVNGVKLIDVTIRDCQRERDNHQGFCGGSLQGVLLQGVQWTNCRWAMWADRANNVSQLDSVTEDCGYGTKIQLRNGSRNVTIQRCLYRRLVATMGAEIQGDDPDIEGVYLFDNAYVLPVLHDDDNQNKHAFAWSLPMAKARKVYAERNYSSGARNGDGRTSSQQWRGLRQAHEVGGTGPTHRNNWIEDLNDPGSITTSTGVQCYENFVRRCVEPFNYGNDAPSPGDVVRDNNDQQSLPLIGGWTLVGKVPPIVDGGVVVPPPVDETAALKLKIAVLEDKLSKGRASAAATATSALATVEALK